MLYIIKIEIVIDSDDYNENEILGPEDARDKAYENISCIRKNQLDVFDSNNEELILVW